METNKDEQAGHDNIGFYFDNLIEYVIYTREAKETGKEVVWLKGDKYKKAFNDIIYYYSY